jgi:hypothetical protein
VTAPIDGRGESVRQLFYDRRYRLGPYQREYTWLPTQVSQLLYDLRHRFMANWMSDHARSDVSKYPQYFLGPYVYYRDGEDTYLVDGQQRVSTLHLLLLHLKHLLHDQGHPDEAAQLGTLIRRSEYGKHAYTIDIPERESLLNALSDGDPYQPADDASPSVRALHQAAESLEKEFPTELQDEALPYFHDWLLNRVTLVGIQAPDRHHGWEIFETMNDRGVRAGPGDLLKTFLLSRSEEAQRDAVDVAWRNVLSKLSILGHTVASDFIKAHLIGHYADLSEEEEKKASDDRIQIENAFHEWVRANHEVMGLIKSPDFAEFVTRDFAGLGETYCMLLAATRRPEPGLEPLFYNAVNGIHAQLHLVIAAIRPDDDLATAKEKARLVAAFLDLVFVRRLITDHALQGSRLDADIYRLIPLLRRCESVTAISEALGKEIAMLPDGFADFSTFALGPSNRRHVRYLLARMTSYTETKLKRPDRIDAYLNEPFQIEHIWANRFDRYSDQVKTKEEFDSWRNRLGALLLLPPTDNASYSDDTYQKKVSYYRNQHALAAALNPQTHTKNKPLADFIAEHGFTDLMLPFGDDFPRRAIEVRQRLYERLCEIIWDSGVLGFAASATTGAAMAPRRTRARYDVTFADLMEAELVTPGARLSGTHKGVRYEAMILDDARIQVATGEIFASPSLSAAFVRGTRSANGWDFWGVETGSERIPIRSLRNEYLRARRVNG